MRSCYDCENEKLATVMVGCKVVIYHGDEILDVYGRCRCVVDGVCQSGTVLSCESMLSKVEQSWVYLAARAASTARATIPRNAGTRLLAE